MLNEFCKLYQSLYGVILMLHASIIRVFHTVSWSRYKYEFDDVPWHRTRVLPWFSRCSYVAATCHSHAESHTDWHQHVTMKANVTTLLLTQMRDSKNKDKINILNNRDRRDTESGWDDLVIIKLIHIDTYISLIVVVVTLQ